MAKNSINRNNKQRVENNSYILEMAAVLFTVLSLASFVMTIVFAYIDSSKSNIGDAAESGIGLSISFVIALLVTVSTAILAAALGFIVIIKRALRKN